MENATATMTLTEFLLARIAEDEAFSHMVSDVPPISAGEGRRIQEGNAAFIPLNLAASPARVLAECAAKRAIVELHTPYGTPQVMVYGTITACETCGSVDDAPHEWPCETLLALAAVYADHPDYREDWRP